MSTPLNKLINFGQSVWLDNISRTLISSGELKSLVAEDGVRGITSNPTIFQKAISKGESYDSQIIKVISENPLFEILDVYEMLAVKDIQDAADTLLPVYKESKGIDGYVSIEVSPLLAYQTQETIDDARKLFAMVNRPNVMIKIPATKEGMPAITQMISEGVNVNVTLIFSPTVYLDVVEAYIKGLEIRAAEGKDISNIASVASFFISRIDTAIDKLLDEKKNTSYKGKIAIANAKLVYKKALELFSSNRFKALEAKGAKPQRLLWASTSTKNPEYPDILYVEDLIGKNTVNTMPPETVAAYKDHGNPMDRIEQGVEDAEKCMQGIKALGINFEDVAEELSIRGVELFIDSFDALLAAIQNKLDKLRDQYDNSNNLNLKPRLTLRNFRKRYNNFFNARFNERLFKKDYTLWKKDPSEDVELSNRLGWLTLPLDMIDDAKEITAFAEEVKSFFEHVVVLGMGGSSLAPEVFFKVFGNKPGYPELKVLDSTHPLAVKNIEEKCNLEKTLFIVASKSGGTIETMSFFNYFYNKLGGNEEAGKNFIAITDPGTGLEKLAKDKHFRKIFSSPAEVGGRFSALTHFGLVPAALIGIDIMELLNRAESQMYESKFFFNSYGYILGMVLGEKAWAGADKLTFITSPSLAPFPVWIEQLVAESTGKEGKGILPLFDPYKYDDLYLEDRVIVYIALKNEKDDETIKFLNSLADYHTIIYIYLDDLYDLAKEFYRWEIITAATGSIMKINPFNQPNVQLAKTLATNAINDYLEHGKLIEPEAVIDGDISVYGDVEGDDIISVFEDFIYDLDYFDYFSVLSYVNPSDENDEAMEEFREYLISFHDNPVTTGYGPRYLHSTGQLHKGGEDNGLFIIFTSDIEKDIEVPGKGYSFGTLISAQAQGDFNALNNLDRRVIRIHFKDTFAKGIRKLIDTLKED